MSVYKRKQLTVSQDIGLFEAVPQPPKVLPKLLQPSAAVQALQPSAATLAMREVLQLAPVLITQLPLATTLRLDGAATLTVTTSRTHYALQRAAAAAVLAGSELGALAIAAENGRASAPWLASWLAARADDPTTQLDVAAALGGIADPATPRSRWPLARVLAAWQLTLTAVGVGDLPDGPQWL